MSEEATSVNSLTTNELVEEFNRLAPSIGVKPVKKFENRRVAVRRVLNARKQAATAETLHGYRGSMRTGEVRGGRDGEPLGGAEPARDATKANRGRGRPPKYGDDAVVRLLVDANPKRRGSKAAARFNAYFEACGSDGGSATVRQLLERGVTRADLEYDVRKGFVEVDDG